MPEVTIEQIEASMRRIIREEFGVAAPVTNDDLTVIQHPTNDKFFQFKATAKVLPDVWFTSNLFWSLAKTDEQRAFIRINVGTDEYGSLKPAFNPLFAQANTWNDDGIAVGTAPGVIGVKQNEYEEWVRDPSQKFLSPEGVKHPTYYAARFRKPEQLIEWARRTAIEFANPNFGAGRF